MSTDQPAPEGERLDFLDALRGIVMALMALDHASSAFNAGRISSDGAAFFTPGSPLPAANFLFRWPTHLCAPTFLLLAGAAVGLRGQRAPSDGRTLDRDLLYRALLLVVVENLWMSWVWALKLQLLRIGVLTAIGFALLLAIPLRRLPAGPLIALALAMFAGLEGLANAWPAGTLRSVLLTAGDFGRYSLLPWASFAVLGLGLGKLLAAGALKRAASWLAMSAASFFVFLVVRGLNGYGNMGLLREGSGLLQWLHVSKYPPSLSFAGLELSIAFALVALLLLLRPPRALVAFGQSALFFYLVHVHLLKGLAFALGVHKRLGLAASVAAWALCLAALVPLCARYRVLRRRHPRSVLRLV